MPEAPTPAQAQQYFEEGRHTLDQLLEVRSLFPDRVLSI